MSAPWINKEEFNEVMAEALEDSRTGNTVSLGDFKQYADDEIDDEE